MTTDIENDRAALEDMMRRLEAAENAGDAEYIVSMMADDVVIMVPSQPVQEGKDACASFLRGMLAWMMEALERNIKYASAEIKVIGDYAFDRGTFSFTATPREGGETAYVQGKYLWLYSRDKTGSWKMARFIVNLDDEPEEGDEPSASES